MGAVIMTLLEAGWQPEEWYRWVDSLGTTWELADNTELDCNMKTCNNMLRSFPRDVLQQVWNQSSLHELLGVRVPWTEGWR